jgi:Flp pilus assembly protein TadD
MTARGEALFHEGVTHHLAARFTQAIDAYRSAIAAGLDVAETHGNLGAALFAVGAYGEALPELQRAFALQPDLLVARRNLGNTLSALGRKDEARECLAAVLAANPRDESTLADLGAVQHELGDFAGARRSFEEALRIHPDFPLALNNLGFLEREEGNTDSAAALFERSLVLEPANPRVAYNLAMARLAQRRFAEGWTLYQARFHTRPPATVPRAFSVPPLATGEIGRVRRVAVWREQGAGDQILYSTPLVELESRRQDFVLEIDARLVPAVRRAHPKWTVVTPEESQAAFATCDRHAAMADVAAMLRPTTASFAAQPRAFVAADAARVSRYRERLAQPGRLLAGISWHSFQKRAYIEARKSAPLEAFAPLAARSDLRLVDLQYGDTAVTRARARLDLARIEELDLFNDLDGVLAAIEACDVVVTTSNVTAHLAGALGKRTLLIFLEGLPHFHYWVDPGTGRSLWYPSVELVSGPEIDSWPRAIARVDELLRG